MKTLPKGKYWIGDPCYVLDENAGFNWDEFVSWTFKDDPSGREREGIVDHQGIKFAFFGTAYGDGSYPDNEGNSYGVDAGCLSCIPVEKIKPSLRLGTIHEFTEDFRCSYDEGTITFGHIEIKTEYEDDDEYEDEY